MANEREAVELLLGRALPVEGVTVRRRRGKGIACTVHALGGRFAQGEYNQTVIIAPDDDAMRHLALDRLRRLIDRRDEIHAMRRAREEEHLHCDVDEEFGIEVDDDMPAPMWRTHGPAALRRAIEGAGLPVEQTLHHMLTDRLTIGEAVLTLGEMTETDMHGEQWVRSIQISAPDIVYLQSITISRITVSRHLPHTIIAGAVGRRAYDLVGLPGLDAPGIVILSAETFRNTKHSGVHFHVSRANALMGDIPRGNTA